jgi:hypothetical protein
MMLEIAAESQTLENHTNVFLGPGKIHTISYQICYKIRTDMGSYLLSGI